MHCCHWPWLLVNHVSQSGKLEKKYGYNIITTFKNLFCNARYSSLKVLERKKIMKNLTFPISLTSIKQCMIEVYEYHYINLCAKTRKMRCILYIKIFDRPPPFLTQKTRSVRGGGSKKVNLAQLRVPGGSKKP